MFDPTIFDNLKTVLEGGLYDLDRENRIRITGRQDLLDLAAMSRAFRMEFVLTNGQDGITEIELSSELSDFAAELSRIRIVEQEPPGCRIRIRHHFPDWESVEAHLDTVRASLRELWGEEVHIKQVIEIVLGEEPAQQNLGKQFTAELTFLRKIDERHIGELPRLLMHTVRSFEKLRNLLR
ncbi:hypothetical protein EFBL_2911 [Effusibacillus lacus]|uniref:Uncharacterized protein n=2 Tax=Effusibacillus lacus TaxID=1348429 RepID=A0A292YRZ1_9BACL|nr:hypothetical protein EFBL_2911 [Effusibacillus lacus]